MRVPHDKRDGSPISLEATLKEAVAPDTLNRIQSLSSVMDARKTAFSRQLSLPSAMEEAHTSIAEPSAPMYITNDSETFNTGRMSIGRGWSIQEGDSL